MLYLAITSRPDIAYCVNYLSQFNTNYNSEHWQAAKRVLRYLKGTSNHGILYEHKGTYLYGVVDADWAGNEVDRRSYSGYAFIFAGSAISWEARKQTTVALSSTEAEYMALSEATKEALYLKGFLEKLNIKCNSVTMYNDNQGTIKLVENNYFHSRTKHIDVRHHFVREANEQKLINIKYLPTDQMPADVLTKGLCRIKHENCLTKLGMTFK